mgnify:CR=1 FL=1
MDIQKQEVVSYLQSLIAPRNELITQMEILAEEKAVPIMDIVGMETLLQLLRLHQPKKILEIGTAIGYSAIRMAEAIPDVTIVTVERDEERYNLAVQFVKEAALQDRIHLVLGDALEEHSDVMNAAPYDFLFVDAAKGQYERFFKMYEKLLKPDGVIITDNVLYKGLVATDYSNLQPRRKKSLVKKIDHFNQWLMNHPDYITTILPVGDGIAISKRRGEMK